jgi:hypothetical protein
MAEHSAWYLEGSTSHVGRCLFREPVEDIDELGEAPGPLGLALLDSLWNTLLDMELQHRQADAIHGGLSRGELLQDVDTLPGLLNHSPDAADLAFDAIQPGDDAVLLGRVEHSDTLTFDTPPGNE